MCKKKKNETPCLKLKKSKRSNNREEDDILSPKKVIRTSGKRIN